MRETVTRLAGSSVRIMSETNDAETPRHCNIAVTVEFDPVVTVVTCVFPVGSPD